jgi:ATP-binding cassette subfamily F protein uup
VTSWAQRFLFRAEQFNTLVGDLSGGEQARILIARLMQQPADVLLLDEPTNDLDIASLDVLEESLETFPGALVLVTHDRYLLDRLCTEILALDGAGHANVFGDLLQWQAARARASASRRPAAGADRKPAISPSEVGNKLSAAPRVKLSYKEKLELEAMEAAVHAAEAACEAARAAAEDPAVASNHVELARRYQALHECQEKVEALYARWAELDAKVQSSAG